MPLDSHNLYNDIQTSILKHFSFLQEYGFGDFEIKQISYETHYKSKNQFVTFDIWYEADISTPIWITLNGDYIYCIELKNKVIAAYQKSLKKIYGNFFQQYLKTNDRNWLEKLHERYIAKGKELNDSYLEEMAAIIKRNKEILAGDLTKLHKATNAAICKAKQNLKKEKITNQILTLEYDFFQNGDYSAYVEFKSIEEIKSYLRANPKIKKYRVLDWNDNEIILN